MKFLVSKENIILFLLALLFLYAFSLFQLLLLVLLLGLALLYFLRIRPPEYKGEIDYKEGMFYSPVNGYIIGYDKDETATTVNILIPWWRSCGIYMPMGSEVRNIEIEKGKKCFRYFYKKSGEYALSKISLSNKEVSFSLSFVKCFLGSWANFYVRPGDRGQSLACMGHYLFGGVVVVKINHDLEVLVKGSDKVFAGETILARNPKSKA